MKTKVPDDIDPSLFVASSTVCDLATPLSAIMLSLEGAIRHLHQNPEKALKRIQRAQGSLQNAISEWIWLQYHLGVRSSQVVDLSIVVERASRFVELLHLYDEPPKFTIKKPENEIQAWGGRRIHALSDSAVGWTEKRSACDPRECRGSTRDFFR